MAIRSPSTAAESWADIALYMTIASLAEILVLHTTEMRAEILRRSEGGERPVNPEQGLPSGEVRLASIGFAARVDAFYRTI